MTDTSTPLRPGVGTALDDAALDQLFRTARTANTFSDEPVSEATLRELYELVKWGPTSANIGPLRILFVTSPEAKERLVGHVFDRNQPKVAQAPVTAVLAVDAEFHEQLPTLFPHNPGMKERFEDPAAREPVGRFNAAIQVGYFIVAARAVGLTAGPIAGFDSAGVDADLLAGTTWRSILVVNLGHPGVDPWFDRLPRLDFDEAARIV